MTMQPLKTLFAASLLAMLAPLNAEKPIDFLPGDESIVTSIKQIEFDDFPDAYNPSILKIDTGYLMTFRFHPDRRNQPWVSFICIVKLDESFEPLGPPQILRTRNANSKTPSQSEDARLFTYRGRTFIIYNDNTENTNPSLWQRRDMYIAEVHQGNNGFTLSTPLKLFYEDKYNTQVWQKNWVPYEWNGLLLLIYSINPHEIVYSNLIDGSCYRCYETEISINWLYGKLRGSTPPQMVDGEYLAFFHSGIATASSYTWDYLAWHYFMGAYTFSPNPPFEITRISSTPIISKGFYTISNHPKRVVFPGGFTVSGDRIHVAYGKDDHEIWIATMDKNALLKSLKPIDKTSVEFQAPK